MTFTFSNKALSRFSLAVIMVYLLSLIGLAFLTKTSFNEFNIFDPAQKHSFAIDWILSPAMFSSGLLMIMFIPGLLLVFSLWKEKFELGSFLACSFIINLFLFICGGTLFKVITHDSLTRMNLLVILIILTAASVIYAALKYKKCHKLEVVEIKFDFMQVFILAIVLISYLFFLITKTNGAPFHYDFNHLLEIPLGQLDDLLEMHGLSLSLKEHLLPYWDLEYADKMGFHVINPPLFYFISLNTILLFGNSQIAYGAILFIFLAGIVILSQHISKNSVGECNFFNIVLIPIYLAFLIFIFSSQRNFLLTTMYAWRVLMVFLFYYFLIQERFKVALLFAIVCFFVFYESIFFIFFGLVLYRFIFQTRYEKMRPFFVPYAGSIVLYCIFMAAIGFFRGDFATYFRTIVIEKFMRFDYFGVLKKIYPDQQGLWQFPYLGEQLKFMKWLLFSSSFFILILFFPKKDRISRFFSYSGIICFLLISVSTYKVEHYVIFLVIATAFAAPRYFSELNSIFKIKRAKPNQENLL